MEGVMGLFDGARARGKASTAHVAKLLAAPVVLVVDAAAMSRSVAAIVHGFASYDPAPDRGHRPEPRRLRLARAADTRGDRPLGIAVLGALRRAGTSRPPPPPRTRAGVERCGSSGRGDFDAGARRRARFDLEAIVALAGTAVSLPGMPWSPSEQVGSRSRRPGRGRPRSRVLVRLRGEPNCSPRAGRSWRLRSGVRRGAAEGTRAL